ncbi:transposable element Tcb1 transposase [Trichonephila clavipes]|nr:transposable element Tcb1 transposase [Trichonephila clavipes]
MKFTTCISAEVRYANDYNFSADTYHARLGDFDDFKFGNCAFLVVFKKTISYVCLIENSDQLLIKYPSSTEEGLVAYRDCGLSFREIGSRVGRNQATVMRICDRWMQQGTTDRRGRSHPPQCNTSREDRQIVRMKVTDHSVTSRTIAHHIESVTHHSESARTIRRRLQQSGLSARRPLLGLPLTQNHRRLRRQWCDERRMWAAKWNEVVFTDESRICLQHHDGRIRVWRHRREDAEQLRYATPHWSCTGYYELGHSHISQDNVQPYVARTVQRFFINHQIELFPWPARSTDFSQIENMWSMVAQRLTQITPPAATPDQLWQRVEAAWSAVPQEPIQRLFESMPSYSWAFGDGPRNFVSFCSLDRFNVYQHLHDGSLSVLGLESTTRKKQCWVLDESGSFFRVHTGYFSNIPKCIKAEFIASWECSQSSVVSSSQR